MSVNPYAPPQAELAPPAPRDARRLARTSFKWFAGSIAVLAAGVGLTGVERVVPLGTFVLAGASVVALMGLVRGAQSLRSARALGATKGTVALGVVATVFNLGMMGVGALASLVSTISFARGRQLRSLGRVLLAPLASKRARGGWAAASEPIEVDPSLRGALAARWRENALTEHASVAAFARLTLDLVALGAPPALLAGAQADALDEIAHAEACFSVARAIDGADVGPGPFPAAARARTLSRVRSLALAELAVDSLIDGALNEGVSARVVAKLARRCTCAPIRAMLLRIAADEGRHSAHGWDVVEWCVAEGGVPVVSALEGAVRALPRTMRTPLPEQAAAGAWEAWGIGGHVLEAEEYARARAHVARRVGQLAVGAGVRGDAHAA